MAQRRYPNNKSSLERWVASGPLFKTVSSNKPVRYKGASTFRAIDRFARGESIDDLFNAFPKANIFRSWLYVPRNVWGASGWDIPSIENLSGYIELCGRNGKKVELTLFTDNDESKLQTIKDYVGILKSKNYDNLLLEGVNEPEVYDKLDVSKLKNTLSNSGYLYSSGIYSDTRKNFYGTYGVSHTPRDGEWPRKAKNLIEYYNGGGPDFIDEPALKMPWVADEPIRPDQAGYNSLDFYTYAALSSIMGAGATFHYESGKLGLPPNELERSCSEAFFNGLEVFPEDAVLGGYEHLRDLEEVDNLGKGTKALRIFAKGSYVVVVRPTGFKAPSNWVSLDKLNVCFTR